MGSRMGALKMAHVRITAARQGGKLVDRYVEIRNGQRVEAALAKAFAAVLGRPCAVREQAAEEPDGDTSVTLRAYDGPLLAASDPRAAEALASSRAIARFEVLPAARARKRGGAWHGAEGELPPPRRRR